MMKKLLKSAAIGLLMLPPIASANLDDGLIAHFPFEGNASDASGNGHHGTLFGGVSFVPNDSGQAAKFNGTNGYIQLNNPQAFNVQHHTVSAWVKWEEGAICCGGGGIFSHTSGDDVIDYYALTINGTSTRQWINYPNSPNQLLEYISNTVNDTHLHHVVATYDGTTRQIWVDGQNVLEGSFNEAINYSNNTIAIIGADFPGGDDYFKGEIDELRVYNRALSAIEIKQLYRGEFTYLQHISVKDMNGNNASELAVLRQKSDKKTQVLIRDSLTGELLKRISFFGDKHTPVSITAIPDLNGNGVDEIAVLAKNNEKDVFQTKIKDMETKEVINTFGHPK